ncbi:MAG: glycosyltransferase family 4 protein [Candidatus Omnitrophica bacterium]|nr:glycosyltransferase family 4 protein [Candidatus Omnitrophota bacterium]
MHPTRVVLLCDRPHWAYDAIAQALVTHNTDPALEMEIAYLKGGAERWQAAQARCDLVFALGWQLVGAWRTGWGRRQPVVPAAGLVERFPQLEPHRTITGLHSHHGWDGGRTQPDRDVEPPASLIRFLRRCRGVNAVSQRLAELFRRAGLPKVAYTPNGVDTELFRPEAPIRTSGPLRVGFSGNPKHDWRKGVSGFIEPACRSLDVELKLAMPQTDQYVPHEQMPQFYNEIDVYLCASSSEGCSLSVLEAAACGRPILSTRVGGCEELIVEGRNGWFVDRRVEPIRERLQWCLDQREAVREAGQHGREVIEAQWSWAKRAPAWLDFIRAAAGISADQRVDQRASAMKQLIEHSR